ncbi:ECF RNA polymerase sigma factor SigR [bacterium HR21]|jgi:RNA polymerase sigma-70 factor (ECF subfamily)|nr:ECF RNA polymerase sigma factor SigR [bacterium HR21]
MDREKRYRDFEREALPHLDAVYSFALYLCRDRELARDLTQETYLRAWQSWESFQPGTNCKAWLLTITRNLYITHYRRRQRSPETLPYTEQEDEEELPPPLEAATPSVEEELSRTALDEEVLRALNALPESFRTIVILCDLEDLSYEDVARMLGVPVGTVRSRLHRARARLAQLLQEYARHRGWNVSDNPSRQQ